MSKQAAGPVEPEKDADGLLIQKYTSTVLVVVPPRDYGDQALRHARSSLYNVRVGTHSVSTQHEDLILGRLQDEFMVDGDIAAARMDAYSGVVFVGGEGALDLVDNADAQRIAREAAAAGKLIGAWGHAVAILARAGVVKGKRVTSAPEVRDVVVAAGAKWTGRQLERDESLVTATDEAVGMRFGKALAQIVGI